jgi:pyrroline-5-carboxylate reductase
MATIGFIGTGEIASAMVNGITDQGHQIYVSNRGKQYAAKLSLLSDVQITNNQDLIDKSDIIILCLLKNTAKKVLPKLNFRKYQKIISVMVDISVADLNTLCNPANNIEITIPLPFIANGNCPLPCYPTGLTVSEVLGKNNRIFVVNSERGLNAHFAVTAMSSVILSQAKISSKWLSQFTQDKDSSEAYILEMLGEYLRSISKSNTIDLNGAIDALNTSGGLNQTLRNHMEKSDISNNLLVGLNDFRERLKLNLTE